MIWDRITRQTSNPLKRAYLRHLTGKLRNYELDHLNRYDGIITISEHDADHFRQEGCRIPLAAVPFGVETEDYKPMQGNYEFPSLFHIGSMNWVPNEEGIRWLVYEAWPLIHRTFPGVKLYLAGRMMPEWLLRLKVPNVEVVGEVPDAMAFIRSKAVMLVPLFSGSGIRIKIIEGMALGKAIISTSIGAEGIHYTDRQNILNADDARAFAEPGGECLASKDFCDRLGKRARELILQEHSLEHVVKKLESFYRGLMEKT